MTWNVAVDGDGLVKATPPHTASRSRESIEGMPRFFTTAARNNGMALARVSLPTRSVFSTVGGSAVDYDSGGFWQRISSWKTTPGWGGGG